MENHSHLADTKEATMEPKYFMNRQISGVLYLQIQYTFSFLLRSAQTYGLRQRERNAVPRGFF